MIIMKNNKIKILQIVPSLSTANGVAAYISTYFQNMNQKDIEMTFMVLNDRNHGRYQEIKSNGGKIIEMYKDCSTIKYLKKLDNFFKNNDYDIIHCHTPNYGAFILKYAKKYGIKVRILHSHVNKSADKLLHKIRNDILSPIAIYNANVYFACSDLAGKYLFKDKKFSVINNAIDINKYKFSEKYREKYRNEFNIEDKFVVGEFGRLCNQKNQLFAIDVFYNILKEKENSVLLLVGNGPLEKKIRQKIQKLDIADKVILLGSRNDVDKLYSCLDTFILPSTYEGLGIVLIEAQANGLSCFTSKNVVPKIAQVTPLLKYISLKEGKEIWAKEILKNSKERTSYVDEIEKKGFNIKKEANNLYNIYKYLLSKEG